MLARDIILKFADRTVVPIQVEEVVYALREAGVQDEIFFFEADIDADILRGRIEHWEYPDGVGGVKRCVDITIARSLTDDWKRLVSCKELLHVLDAESNRVSSDEDIRCLEEEMVLPPELQDPEKDSLKTINDRLGSAYAAAVLFPKAGRDALVQTLKEGNITIAEIARIVDIPPLYASVVMSSAWIKIYRLITTQ